jgi:hypothetical protein
MNKTKPCCSDFKDIYESDLGTCIYKDGFGLWNISALINGHDPYDNDNVIMGSVQYCPYCGANLSLLDEVKGN